MVISRTKQDQGFSNPGFLGQDFAEFRDPGIFWMRLPWNLDSKILWKKSGKSFSAHIPLPYESQNWKHDLARLCFMLYTPSLIKNENFVIVEQGGGGPFDVSGGPFVVLEILEKHSEFGNFFSKILKIWSKFWRWEGYIGWKFFGWNFFGEHFLGEKFLGENFFWVKIFLGWKFFLGVILAEFFWGEIYLGENFLGEIFLGANCLWWKFLGWKFFEWKIFFGENFLG